jgi:tricorn protease-like protein
MFMDELQQHQRVQRVVQSQQIIRSHEHLSIKYRKQTSFVNNVIVASTESTIITYEGDDENIRRFIDQFNRIQAIITQESAEEELTSVTDARRLVTWLLIYKCTLQLTFAHPLYWCCLQTHR